MNKYTGISHIVVTAAKNHANKIYRKLNKIFDYEDLVQDFIVTALQALNQFNVKKGSIRSFLNTVLKNHANLLLRKYFQNNRYKTALETDLNLNAENMEVFSDQKNIDDELNINLFLDYLPAGLRKIAEKLKIYSISEIKKQKQIIELKKIKKILSRSHLSRFIFLGARMKNISCIETLSTRELSKLSDLDLCDLTNKVDESFSWIKSIKTKLEDAIQIKYENTARAELQQQNKDFGTVAVNNGKFVIKTEIPKKVVWDQEILASVFEKMEPAIRRDIFNVTYSIDEKKYAQLQPNMQAAVNPARTTQPGRIKITIKEKERK